MVEVSVIIPVYNACLYINESLSSITNQSLQNIEIILIDDGSTDGSGELLDQAAELDHRIQVIHQPNGGIVKALNVGLEAARGKYIARMDADDISWRERLRIQRDFLDNQADFVAVGSLVRYISTSGQVTGEQSPRQNARQSNLTCFPPFVRTVPHPTLMARGKDMRRLGYRYEFEHAEDHDLFVRLSRVGKIGMLQQVLLDYRIHSESVSARFPDVQLRSVLSAQKHGMLVARTGLDSHFSEAELDEILSSISGTPSRAAWELLLSVNYLNHALDRRSKFLACIALGRLLKQALVCFPKVAFRDYFKIARSAAYSTIRLAYMIVRV